DISDCLDNVIGAIVLCNHNVDSLMLAWSENENMWLRRVAIHYQLNRKENTNTELLANIIIHNLGSNQFFINKAIGTSLREYSKTNPEWVKNFITKYRHNMHKLSIKEASRYI
ncbi:MAG: DNA alkylation repair protein, partial [Erysipelotrichia bacterium]|nr:DNA alkylation repair protein [Erysipelotrichia bacterium]